MASVQERSKLKRVPYDTWSTREQLCLASGVSRSGDQNWISVSRSLKPFAEKEALRPPDWFSQKSCAVQYAHLLENADTPKRKKRESGETAGESIVRRLTQERIAELRQILAFQRDEYQQLKAEVNLLKGGPLSDEKLQKMWHAIEQEEREQEQKARAHAAWLAKRQQKQDCQPSQSVVTGIQRKPGEAASENHETTEPVNNEDDDKKNRDGRSPLLTSLLKSPSPTTQIQTQTTPAQVGSPTIASLLGSSPKVPNPQLTRTVSPQLQQLVSTALANATPERPSAGAPTLSMLLELPANSQRGPLPNLQRNANPEVHIQSRSAGQTTPQNPVQVVRAAPAPTTPSIPVTESMVQIIDHIDDVVRKDIMADVIDKDEINEIIGDIEELIKEEITSSPRTNETMAVTPIATPVAAPVVTPVDTAVPATLATASTIESLTLPQKQGNIQERQEPRDVDEPISLSDSADSEMAIGEIDSSTSNIAEIIGTVAVEPIERKIIPSETCKIIQEEDKESKDESISTSEQTTTDLKCTLETKIKDHSESKDISTSVQEVAVESKEKAIPKSTVCNTAEPESVSPAKEPANDEQKEESKEEKSDVVEPEKDKTCDTTGDKKEDPVVAEKKDAAELDQLEIHLAEITGDPQDIQQGAESVSVSSETRNDIPSVEDAEKTQDISLILEDDSSQNSQGKNKAVSDGNVEAAESFESKKEEAVAIQKVETVVLPKEETVAMPMEETNVEDTKTAIVLEKEADPKTVKDESSLESKVKNIVEVKKEDTMDSSESTSPAPHSEETKKKEADEEMKTDVSNIPALPKDTGDVKKGQVEIEESMKPDVKFVSTTETEITGDVKQETKDIVEAEQIVKKEAAESIVSSLGEPDEEESGLSKLSGGRAMKTYSKRQPPSVDSEPENETGGEGADYRAWKKAVMLVFNRLATHKYASVFLRPITEDQAPGYHSVIFRPMDLSTIKKNIDNGTIRSTMHFQRDVMLMFQNAIMYNKQDTFVYQMAVSMQEECLQHMQILVQVTGEGPFRRETRTATSTGGEISDAGAKRKRSHITPSPHESESPRNSKKRRKSEND